MSRRIAKKVRKRWKAAVDQDDRVRAFRREIGPEGEAQRKMFAKMFKSPVQPSKYESGWWPTARLIHHLRVKKRSHYSQVQVQRAYRKLPHAERMEWQIDSRLIRARLEREAYEAEHGGWALALRDMERMPLAMGALALRNPDSGEAA